MTGPDLRPNIDAALVEKDAHRAACLLRELWRTGPSLSAAGFIAERLPQLRGSLPLTSYRLAILRSFTLEPVVPLVRALAFCAGIDLEVQLGEFNAFTQEILDPESSLYKFRPDAVILAAQTADVGPDLASSSAQAAGRIQAQYSNWIQSLRAHTNASLIVHGLEVPAWPDAGILDSRAPEGQVEAVQSVNAAIRALAREHTGVYFCDYDGLVARHGRQQWRDERKWVIARMPIAAGHLLHVAEEWMRFLHPLTGKLAKAVAVDLDNTLWGGVIGEDGMAGIKLGQEYPGYAYQSLQRALLDLHRRGILLALCSKNNPEDAMQALEGHPGMLLKPHHFAAMRIGWEHKPVYLRQLAEELNIGVDALAFIDDNPVERQAVRDELPEVHVVELPADAMGYALAIRQCPLFERLHLSEEDRKRGEYYAAQRERATVAAAHAAHGTKEDFYRSLEQVLEIEDVTPMTLARVAQLTQKTNQFNVTTRRLTEQQIQEIAAHPACHVLSVRVQDRFGDNGLTGVAITRDDGDVCEIDTFLLSCRVIGRTVETAILAHIVADARARRRRYVQGWFYPTKKNQPAASFYQEHGFTAVEQAEQGTRWLLDLESANVRTPEWITVLTKELQV